MIVLDIETSSSDPYRGSILSIGAVELENPNNTFYQESQLEEGADVQPRALEVNGFTLEQITDTKKKSVKESLLEFLEWYTAISDQTIAGHNVGYFDLRFMEIACTRYELGAFGLASGNYRTIDLHTLGYAEFLRRNLPIPMKNGLSAISMDSVLGLVGLQSEPKPHNALTGAKLEAEAMSRILFGKELFL